MNEIETEVEFFGDNDFLGSPPYANVDSFARSWDLIKVGVFICTLSNNPQLDHPGKAKRAKRNSECYAFFLNIAQFLSFLQVHSAFLAIIDFIPENQSFLGGKEEKAAKGTTKDRKIVQKRTIKVHT